MKQAVTEQLLQKYNKLPEIDRELMQLAAIQFGPSLATELASLYRLYCKGANKAKVPTDVEIRSKLRQLATIGLLVSPRGYYGDRLTVETSILDRVHRSALCSPQYNAMSRAVFPNSVTGVPGYEIFYSNWVTGRVLRTAFYEGHTDVFSTVINKRFMSLTGHASLQILTPFCRELFESLPPELQVPFLVDAATTIVTQGSGDSEIYDVFHEHVARDNKLEMTPFFCLLDWAIAAGDIDGVRRLHERAQGTLPETAGVLAFAMGDFEVAAEQFAMAHERFRKMTKKRRFALPHLAGILRVCLLLRANSITARRDAKSDIAHMRDEWPAAYGAAIAALAEAVDEQGKLDPRPGATLLADATHLSTLISTLTSKWLTSKFEPDRSSARLQEVAQGYAKAGLRWFAETVSDLSAWHHARRSGGEGPTNEQLADELRSMFGSNYQRTGFPSLVGLIEPQAEWARTLQSLKELSVTRGGATTSNAAGATSQLIWELEIDEHRRLRAVTPRVRNRLKSGRWGRGKEWRLSNLYEAKVKPHAHPYLTEQDLRIAECIQMYDPYAEVYGYRGRHSKHSWRLADVALKLIGHPLVFRPQDDIHPIEIVHRRPHLWITEDGATSGATISMSLQPSYDPDEPDRVVALEDGPHRMVLVTFSQDDIELALRLKTGLSIPAEAREQVAEVARELSSLVSIQSEMPISSEHVTQVDADPRPHLHLVPHIEGVRVEFFVRPLGHEGPFHRPGEGAENAMFEGLGEKRITRRDLKAEWSLATQLVASCPSLQRLAQEPNVPFLFATPAESLELMLELRPALENETIVVHWPQGERFANVRSVTAKKMTLSIKRERDWFAASGKLELDDDQVIDMMEVLERLNSTSSRFVQLSDGSFLALTQEFRQRLSDLMAFSERREDDVIFPMVRAAAMQDLSDTFEVRHDDHWEKCLTRLTDAMNHRPTVPKTFKAELRDYQKDGFDWLSRLAHWGMGACLADDMGLGKTIQALAMLVDRAKQGPALIVAPTSVTYNWLSEASRFAPTLNVSVFGAADRDEVMHDLGPRDVVITSYGLLHNEADRFHQRVWTTVVLDEAQAIKNMATKRSQAAMGLQADFRMVLTGTPLENHLGELWNLFQFINPGLLGSWKAFQDQFAVPIERDRCADSRRRLKKLIQPFILRRTKTQVLKELPSRTEVTMQVELTREEANFYESLRQTVLSRLSDVASGDRSQHLRILGEIMRLRRACCHPKLAMPDSRLPASKLALFLETVDELLENGHKALVFSQFVDHLTILREALDQRGIVYQYLDGRTPAKERRNRVEAFQSGEGDLFLISLKAGGMGLNLTAADYVLHMDPWWNPAVEDQASDRAHRLGQLRPVTIYRFITTGTIEEQILELHGNKRDLADSLLDGTDVSGKLSTDELLRLLRGQ